MVFFMHGLTVVLLGHLLLEARDSVIVRDFGDAFRAGMTTVMSSQIILIIFIMLVQLWGYCSAIYFIERSMYLRVIIASVTITAVSELTAQGVMHARWIPFRDALADYCQSPDNSASQSIVLSKWRDFDLIYRFNDFLVEQGACEADFGEQLSSCQMLQFQRAGLLDSHVDQIKMMEMRHASARD